MYTTYTVSIMNTGCMSLSKQASYSDNPPS